MEDGNGRAAFRALPRSEKEQLYLDILETPPFDFKGSWGEWLHTWLEDQSAEGRPLGEIAKRMDFPTYQDPHLARRSVRGRKAAWRDRQANGFPDLPRHIRRRPVDLPRTPRLVAR